jgi:arylsulfatase A-like enzyme
VARATRAAARRRLAVLVTALLPAAAAAGYTQAAPPAVAPAVGGPQKAPAAARSAAKRLSEHVIVISVDGLRPDAIGRFGARNLQRLMAEGTFSLEATTILPSSTLPSHTSMLTGTEPGTHGVTWNSEELEEHGYVATPTIFSTAKAAGLHTAAFFSKSKFQHLAAPGTLDYFQAPDGWPGMWLAKRTVGDVERYLRHARPNLLFVHIAEPDFAGHLAGWMTSSYGWAVQEADAGVGRVLAAAGRAFGAGNYTVLVTADHGGHGRDHGSDDPRDVTIPWIAWGRGIAPAGSLEPGIRTMDTAATALQLLGLAESANAVGRPVAGALVSREATVAAGTGTP